MYPEPLLRPALHAFSPYSFVFVFHAHSWYGYNLEEKRPDLVRKFVALDIGGHFIPDGLFARLFMATYQLFLAFAFLFGRPLGDLMARGLVALSEAENGRIARASTCYPYYQMWKLMILNGGPKKMVPQCPVLFIYGCNEPKTVLVRYTSSLSASGVDRGRSYHVFVASKMIVEEVCQRSFGGARMFFVAGWTRVSAFD